MTEWVIASGVWVLVLWALIATYRLRINRIGAEAQLGPLKDRVGTLNGEVLRLERRVERLADDYHAAVARIALLEARILQLETGVLVLRRQIIEGGAVPQWPVDTSE